MRKLLIVILILSIILNIFLFIRRPSDEMVFNSVIINCERDIHRRGKVTCNGLTNENEEFKFSFTLPYPFYNPPYSYSPNKDI